MQNKKFLDPESVLFRTGLSRNQIVADLGAGSGFFALASAKIVGDGGQVFVLDVVEQALEHVNAEARLKNLKNIKTIRADLEKVGVSGVATGSVDLVIAANLIHQLGNPKELMTEVYRILKTGGKLLVIDWNQAPALFGPKHGERVLEEDVKSAAVSATLKFDSLIETDQYHFGLTFVK